MFLPTTPEELKKLGWKKLDVIIITGDAYIDSSFTGAAVIGKVLVNAGYRVGVIAQPDVASPVDITRLGEPALFWGVTSGAVDSMVANHTPLMKPRRSDDFTPGGVNIKRPDRAVIAYSNLIRRYYKNTVPIVLGGIEASLRRVTHYDYWSDSLRRPVIFDAKADAIVYGMGEKAVVEMAGRFKSGAGIEDIRGVSYIAGEPADGYIVLPSYEEAAADKKIFIEMFNLFYQNSDPVSARGLCQKVGTRYLIQNPPAPCLSEKEMDEIYGLGYERDAHPYYKKMGEIRALDTIRTSVTTHRGCYGECNFCAIAVHQGRTVQSRSGESIIREVTAISKSPGFNGYISDVGGPTANMYAIECEKKIKNGACRNKRCLYPRKCASLDICHKKQIELLKKLSAVKGVKKIFVASGIRYDMILQDVECGGDYLENLVANHVSGQLKIAPEHVSDKVLDLMGKPGVSFLKKFKDDFYRANERSGKKQFLTYYLIAAHPGCDEADMISLKKFAAAQLQTTPEQVQIFTPTPSTYSTLMYYTEMNPFTGAKIFVEKGLKKKEMQKNAACGEVRHGRGGRR